LPRMFCFTANEQGWKFHPFTVFNLLGKTRNGSFGVPPSGGYPGTLSCPAADRLKPELRTVFMPAPKITPNLSGNLSMTGYV
jgi:hypothetical protein